MTKDDELSEWIAVDHARLFCGIPWVLKEMDNLLENKFKVKENMKDCNRIFFNNCLRMHYLFSSEKLKDKRDTIAAHLQLTKERSHDLKHLKVQPRVFSG